MAKFDPLTTLSDCIVFCGLDAIKNVTSCRSLYHAVIATNRSIKLLDFLSNLNCTTDVGLIWVVDATSNDIFTNFCQHVLPMARCQILIVGSL